MLSSFKSLITLALKSGLLLPPHSVRTSMLCKAIWAAPGWLPPVLLCLRSWLAAPGWLPPVPLCLRSWLVATAEPFGRPLDGFRQFLSVPLIPHVYVCTCKYIYIYIYIYMVATFLSPAAMTVSSRVDPTRQQERERHAHMLCAYCVPRTQWVVLTRRSRACSRCAAPIHIPDNPNTPPQTRRTLFVAVWTSKVQNSNLPDK